MRKINPTATKKNVQMILLLMGIVSALTLNPYAQASKSRATTKPIVDETTVFEELEPDPENPNGPFIDNFYNENFQQLSPNLKLDQVEPDQLLNEKTQEDLQQLLEKYAFIDKKQIIPKKALRNALLFYDKYESVLLNKRMMTVVDFTPHRFKSRMFLVDMKTGDVRTKVTTHGSGSDRNRDGYADRFSNIINSHASSLGYYITLGTYTSKKFKLALRLKGISESNNNALERAILVHGANYIWDRIRTSWGCFALEHAITVPVIRSIQNGSLLYAWIDPNELSKRSKEIELSKRKSKRTP